MAKPLYTIEIYQAVISGQWYFSIRHRNGHIVSDGGEGQHKKAQMIRSIKRMQKELVNAPIVLKGDRNAGKEE